MSNQGTWLRDPETGAAYEFVPPDPIETVNEQLVGLRGTAVTVMIPRASMSKSEALLHAAWLVTLAESITEVDCPTFEDYRAAVRST